MNTVDTFLYCLISGLTAMAAVRDPIDWRQAVGVAGRADVRFPSLPPFFNP